MDPPQRPPKPPIPLDLHGPCEVREAPPVPALFEKAMDAPVGGSARSRRHLAVTYALPDGERDTRILPLRTVTTIPFKSAASTRPSAETQCRSVRSPGPALARGPRQRRARDRGASQPGAARRSDRSGTSLTADAHRLEAVVRYGGPGVSQAGPDVLSLEIRVVGEHLLFGLSLREQAEDQLDGDPHPADDRLAAEDLRVRRDPLEKFALLHVLPRPATDE